MVNNMNILYHGRFQPPHRGHIEVIRYFLKKYSKSNLIISLDTRKKDLNNPFSYDFRKKIFLDNLKDFEGRITITTHKCIKPTFQGCLPPTYENAKKFGKIDLVIGGPELPKEVKEFWKTKGIKTEIVNKRFFDISGTEIKKVHNSKSLGFSIITAFGCKYNHGYCVWKRFHKLNNLKTTCENTNWIKLDELIHWYSGNKINVSGGLDPLYNFTKNKNWWEKLFEICKKYNKLVDVHTREFIFDKSFLENINKIVFSFDNLEEIRHEIVKYPKNVKIRLAKIITQETSFEELKEIIEFCKKNNFEITFKEIYGFDDKGNFNQLKNKLSKIYNFKKDKIVFLKHKDYNLYFMPDNKVYTKFLI